MRIQATLLAIASLVCAATAQIKIALDFPTASEKEIFTAPFIPHNPPDATVKASGKAFEYTVGAFGGSDKLYIWDKASNNIASKLMKDVGSSWALKETDFNLIGTIQIHLEHEGQPLQAAQVVLTVKGKSEQRLLDPAGKGTVTFFGFPAGDATVKAVYNTKDGKQSSQEQIFKLATNRDKAEPILALAIGDDVTTAAPSAGTSASKPGAADEGKPKEVEQGSAGGKFIFIIISLVLVAAIVFVLMQAMKKNPKAFEDRLTALGVQIPKPADPDDNLGPVAVPQMARPAPPQKIVLDDADPTPLGSAPVTSIASPMSFSTGAPTLISESGSRITLTDGENLVGREDGLPVSLAGESTVSRRHASIVKTGTEAILSDLGSTNGTFVNGMRLQSETVLKPGDQVQFGSVKFRYEG